MSDSNHNLTRRAFVSELAAGLVIAPAIAQVRMETSALTRDGIPFASASELARAIRLKRFSSLEVVDAYLQRIALVNPKINALVFNVGEAAREAARAADRDLAQKKSRGPLHGVPVSIKDSFDTAGIVSTAGTTGWARRVPDRDATVVARLRAAGAIILGKTNTPEFTLSDETDNLVYGRTNNPYDLTRTSGGSSGGPAALIAAGGSPLDVGSDTGNSIRMPSHFCGIAGLKPTSGRVPRTGHAISFSGPMESWTQIGPMARYVDDLMLVLPIIAGPDWVDPHVASAPLLDPQKVNVRGMRVAIHANNGLVTPTAETQAAVRAAGRALASRGARVDERTPPGLEDAFEIAGRLQFADGGSWALRLIQTAGTRGNGSLDWLTNIPRMSSAEFVRGIEEMDNLRSRLLGFMQSTDVIICPVHPTPAVRHGGSQSGDFNRGDSYSVVYNVTGWPAAAVRAATSPEGLPIAVQIVGRPWREDQVLAVAKIIESELGGWKRPPNL